MRPRSGTWWPGSARLGLGVIVDIVPNHMAVPVPESLNQPLWSVLRDGTGSPFAGWFDVDWAAQDGRLLMPVLGGPLSDCLGDLAPDTSGAEPVLRYFDHEFPVRPAPRPCRWPGCWTPSTTGWPTGTWRRRS